MFYDIINLLENTCEGVYVMYDFLNRYYNLAFLIAIIFYNLFPKKIRPFYLLFFSWLFFALMSKWLIIFLLLTTISIYASALVISKLENKKKDLVKEAIDDDKKIIKDKFKKKKRVVLILCIIFNVAFLFVFKYLKFFTLNANYLLDCFNVGYNFNILKLIAPIGISFYTLQALSYLFDVYNKKQEADKNYFRVALFMSFFPSIMEGPITRYSDTAEDLYKGEKITYESLCFGLQRILWGLFKKIIIADRLNVLVKTVFSGYEYFSGIIIFIGALCYTIMLYMDFSGAMDVVLGIGDIFKVKVPENFKQPFFSKNISEFWTRWHISLGTWFRDYIYYPISLSKPMKSLTLKLKKHLGNHYGPLLSGTFALLVVWLLNGLWHGAGWTYILFGLYHFIMISIGNITRPEFNKLYVKLNISKSKVLHFLQILKTSFLVVIGELIFNSSTVNQAFKMIKKIFTNFKVSALELSSLGLDFPDCVILMLALVVVLIIGLKRENGINVREKLAKKNIVVRWIILYILIFSILIFGAFGPGYEPVDPMYADF